MTVTYHVFRFHRGQWLLVRHNCSNEEAIQIYKGYKESTEENPPPRIRIVRVEETVVLEG